MFYRCSLAIIFSIIWCNEQSISFSYPSIKKSPSISIANSFLGVPYREDGVENILGLYTIFNMPERIFSEPGLNCSGFLLSVIRQIYQKPITIEMVERDRKHDSGEGSKLGHDWDYGLDVIWNLVEATGQRATHILPRRVQWNRARGFNLHKKHLWEEVLGRIKPGNLYLFSINKETRKRGYQHIFYHVGLIIPDKDEHAWFYHATKKSNVHRMDLNSEAGLERFFYQFAESKVGPKYIYILEIPEPNLIN